MWVMNTASVVKVAGHWQELVLGAFAAVKQPHFGPLRQAQRYR